MGSRVEVDIPNTAGENHATRNTAHFWQCVINQEPEVFQRIIVTVVSKANAIRRISYYAVETFVWHFAHDLQAVAMEKRVAFFEGVIVHWDEDNAGRQNVTVRYIRVHREMFDEVL